MQGNVNGTSFSSQELILLAHDSGAEGAVPERRRFRVLHRPNRQTACLASTTFSGQRQLFFPINDNYSLGGAERRRRVGGR